MNSIDELYEKMTWEERMLQLASFYPNGIKRLKIGNMQQGEALHGINADEATSFPQAIALGATFNPDLVEKIASVIAREARALGKHHCYSPMLGVARDIRWGRTEEAYGEDPCLVAKTGAAFINGLQGKGKERFAKDKVIATAKHFVADAEPLSGNNGASVDISNRLLNEVHLVPFRAAVEEAKVGSIMPAHHALNGIPCHMNKYLIQHVLRDTYGFDGFTVSDNGDIRMLKTGMGITDSLLDAAKLALEAGVDTELAWLCPMGENRAYGTGLLKACKEETIDVSLVERSVKRVLKAKDKMGLLNVSDEEFENDEFFEFQGDTTGEEHIHYADMMRSFGQKAKNYKEVLYDDSSNELAREAARQALILLKNENNLLPIDLTKLKKIAVIGPNATARLLGGYSTKNPRYYVSVLDGIKAAVDNRVAINYVEALNRTDFTKKDIDGAVKAAQEADVVIVTAGGNELTCKENQDVDTLDLVGDQSELIQKVTAANSNTVLVLLHGRPNAIAWESEHVPAILEGFYLGQETGNAIADVLFGAYNPGGKLPLTVPRNVGQCPAFYNKYPFGRAVNYYNSSELPLYPFGYGLSYTTFSFSEPKVSKEVIHYEEELFVSVIVKNTGNVKGDEVIQLYLHDTLCSYVRPVKDFRRITLEPGEERTVIFLITMRMLEFYKEDHWCVEAGTFELMTGNNSRDLKTTYFTLLDGKEVVNE